MENLRPLSSCWPALSDHNELLYSMRSLVAALDIPRLPTFHLVSADLPYDPASFANVWNFSSVDPSPRLQQIPHWLDQTRLKSSNLRLHPHSTLFTNASSLPSFNSLAIECEISRVNASDIIVYLNVRSFHRLPLRETKWRLTRVSDSILGRLSDHGSRHSRRRFWVSLLWACTPSSARSPRRR